MRRTMMALALFGLSSTASAAGVAMDVATFLAKADGLRAKGPLALFSSDLTVLKTEGMAAGKNLRNERLAQIAAGKRPDYCAPAGSRMGQDEFMNAMLAVPSADRPRTSVQAAMKAYFVRKFPCPATQR